LADKTRSKTIHFDYYLINSLKTESRYDIAGLLHYIASLEVKSRSITYGEDANRLLSVKERHNLLVVHFGRYKSGINPKTGNINTDEIKGLSLASENERLVEDVVMAYDPELKCAFLQYNRNSLSASSIATYLSNFLSKKEKKDGEKIEFSIMLHPDTLSRIKGMTKITDYKFNIDNIYSQTIRNIAKNDVGVSKAIEMAEGFADDRFDANGTLQVKVEIIAKTSKESVFALIQDKLIGLFFKLPPHNAADLSHIKVAGYAPDQDNKIEVCLYNDKLREDEVFNVPVNSSLSQEKVMDFMVQRYMEKREQIRTLLENLP
jgi:hypothetical protein